METPEQTAERRVHMTHCNQGEYEGTCKYGEADCPAQAVAASDAEAGMVLVDAAEIAELREKLAGAYEEAANVAESYIKENHRPHNEPLAALKIASSIRNLKDRASVTHLQY